MHCTDAPLLNVVISNNKKSKYLEKNIQFLSLINLSKDKNLRTFRKLKKYKYKF